MKETVTICRVLYSENGTFGVLVYKNRPICVTCEDPWEDNKPNISCIPTGTYNVIPHSGDRFKGVWEITMVPGRKAVLIHNGNTIKDTHGCILVGSQFGDLDGLPSVNGSVMALNKLRGILPKEFKLVIMD